MNTETMPGTIETLDNLESLFNTDLTELAGLPDLKVPPIGRYALGVTVSTKEEGEHPQVVIKYEIVECLEQVNTDDTPAKVGDLFTVNYNIDNKYGMGKLEKDLQVYSTFFNTTNIGEILQNMEGVQITGTVKRREDKKTLDDDGNPRVYGTVVNVEIQ